MSTQPIDVLAVLARMEEETARAVITHEEKHLRHWDAFLGEVMNTRAAVAELIEALRLADAALSGAHMDMAAVEKKVRAALSRVGGAS